MNETIDFEKFKKRKEEKLKLEQTRLLKKRMERQRQEYIEAKFNLKIPKEEFARVISQLKTYMAVEDIEFKEYEKSENDDLITQDIKVATSHYDNMKLMNFLKDNNISFNIEQGK